MIGPKALPVTIISGYLGAGKTTLVNNALRKANGLKLAILVNEFGNLAIDEDLIIAQDDNMISLAGGCICCSYGNGSFLFKLGALHISSGGNFGAEDGEKFVVEYDEATSSVLENQISNLAIYPNPVNNFATLSFNVEGMERTYVELVNTIGQTLQTIDLGVVTGSQLVELNALDLPSGIYLVNIKSGANNVVTRMTVTK